VESDAGQTNVTTVYRDFFHSPTRKIYYTLISVVVFFLPVTVMSLAYVVIICRLWVHRKPGENAATRQTFAGHSSLSIVDEAAQVNVKKRVSCGVVSAVV